MKKWCFLHVEKEQANKQRMNEKKAHRLTSKEEDLLRGLRSVTDTGKH